MWGWVTNDCSVLAELSVSAVSREIADAVAEQLAVDLVQEPGRLVIVLRKPQEHKDNYCVSGRMTITVPLETRAAITTTYGDCCAENITRQVAMQSTHGDILFDNIRGDIVAVSTYGDIKLANTQNASVNATTTHGGIKLDNSNIRQVRCSTIYGPIRLKAILADRLDLQTSQDSIELTACTAKEAELNTSYGAIGGDIGGIERITARTSHAPIDLRCVNESSPNLAATLSTTYNNIAFCPPAGFAGRVSASTSYGHIRTDRSIVVQGVLGEQLNGTIGEGTGSITLTTTHGNIDLKNPNPQ
ncbi:MAG TPA: DUF4097 family beta strand repeat-containing protein [Anaerohalosphaeraceae bacterium]|nr:DUF4097 family beta strand repeat-containing protein [Anaerohalosphaeraceae bacterium]HOL31551.1 DUF4097 family beta strand repeat-containing protein [Anaerohalosphaeraceae bacterium]HPO68772.1 DUF4097 family beta strand repeat-containing protein [Anaerohalosphaeraceae bacterium]